MKKIILGNSGCDNCISPFKLMGQDCRPFINKMVNKGLVACTNSLGTENYIHIEKESKMLNTEMVNELQAIFDMGGFVQILDYAGITQVFVPVTRMPDNRMYFFGQSVCNKTDTYKRKKGIKLALQDLKKSEKQLPIDLIDLMDETGQIMRINSVDQI